MTTYEFQQMYRRERRILSLCFLALLVVIGGAYLIENWQEVAHIAVHAAEHPRQTFSSFIRGMAQR